MAQTKIVGYKNIFGFVLPDWIDESLVRTMVMFFLSIVVMLFVLLLVIWPKFSDIDGLKDTLKTNTASLNALKSSQEGFNKLNSQIPEDSQNIVLSAIPQSYSPENAVFLLRKIANETGVSITSYKLPSGVLYSTNGEKQKDSNGTMVGFISYPVRISVSAPVSSLLSFIDKIESSLPYGVVSDLNMQEVTKLSRSTNSVTMDLEIKYFQAILNKVDITKVQPISDADLSLVEKMTGFSKYSTASTMGSVATTSSSTTANLFGF